MKLGAFIGIPSGAIFGLCFAAYHNAHVSVWTGGYIFNAKGYFLLAYLGAFIGELIGVAIGWSVRSDKIND